MRPFVMEDDSFVILVQSLLENSDKDGDIREMIRNPRERREKAIAGNCREREGGGVSEDERR